MKIARWALWAALALLGCQRFGEKDAVALVMRYNAQNCQAYRTGDARLTEETTGLEEGKRLLGLIGVRLDSGLVLDAELKEFEVLRAEGDESGWEVDTREKWHWAERRIGSGAQVGADSDDSYLMRYRLGRENGRWVVLRTQFVEAPQVGRKDSLWTAPARDMHGLPAKHSPPADGGQP